MKKGNDLIITIDGVAVAASRSCTVQVDCNTKEVGMKGSGGWKRYIATRKGWTVNVSYLVGDATRIMDLLSRVGQTVDASWKMRDNVTDTLGGKAIVTECKVSGTRGSLVQGSFTFKGTGELG